MRAFREVQDTLMTLFLTRTGTLPTSDSEEDGDGDDDDDRGRVAVMMAE
jgi:hypothetical protein